MPVTRSDIMHECDLVEDLAIAFGYNNLHLEAYHYDYYDYYHYYYYYPLILCLLLLLLLLLLITTWRCR